MRDAPALVRFRSPALCKRKTQLLTLKPTKTADFGTCTVKRPTENRERKTAESAPGTATSQGARSRGRCPKPRQHRGNGQKNPNRIRVGISHYGGGTRNPTRVRFQNQIVTHGSFGRGFDDLAEPQLGATSRLQRSSNGDLTPGRPASACDANPDHSNHPRIQKYLCF